MSLRDMVVKVSMGCSICASFLTFNKNRTKEASDYNFIIWIKCKTSRLLGHYSYALLITIKEKGQEAKRNIFKHMRILLRYRKIINPPLLLSSFLWQSMKREAAGLFLVVKKKIKQNRIGKAHVTISSISSASSYDAEWEQCTCQNVIEMTQNEPSSKSIYSSCHYYVLYLFIYFCYWNIVELETYCFFFAPLVSSK